MLSHLLGLCRVLAQQGLDLYSIFECHSSTNRKCKHSHCINIKHANRRMTLAKWSPISCQQTWGKPTTQTERVQQSWVSQQLLVPHNKMKNIKGEWSRKQIQQDTSLQKQEQERTNYTTHLEAMPAVKRKEGESPLLKVLFTSSITLPTLLLRKDALLFLTFLGEGKAQISGDMTAKTEDNSKIF